MDACDIHTGVLQVLVIAWIYRVYLNLDWLWIVGTSTQSKYCFQGYAVCSTGTSIWHGNLSAAHRRNCDVVEDAGNDIDFVGVVIGKCEDKVGKKAPANITLATLLKKK